MGYRKIEGFSFIGIAFTFISVLSFSIGNVIQKRNSLSLINNLKIQFMCSSVLFLVPLLFGQWKLDFTYQFSLALFWMVFVVSIGATLLLLYMIKASQASKVSSLFFCCADHFYFSR